MITKGPWVRQPQSRVSPRRSTRDPVTGGCRFSPLAARLGDRTLMTTALLATLSIRNLTARQSQPQSRSSADNNALRPERQCKETQRADPPGETASRRWATSGCSLATGDKEATTQHRKSIQHRFLSFTRLPWTNSKSKGRLRREQDDCPIHQRGIFCRLGRAWVNACRQRTHSAMMLSAT